MLDMTRRRLSQSAIEAKGRGALGAQSGSNILKVNTRYKNDPSRRSGEVDVAARAEARERESRGAEPVDPIRSLVRRRHA